MAKKKAKRRAGPPTTKPYGVAIQQAVASGRLAQMRAAQKAAEKYLADHGNVAAALEALKAEIAKLEAGG